MDYNILKQLLTTKKINIPTLAKEIGMSKTGLYIAIDNERLTVAILEKIAQVLDVPVAFFFSQSLVDWVPVSEVEKLNNEITGLQNRLKEVEEQLDDKRQLLEYFKEKKVINAKSLILSLIEDYARQNGLFLTKEEYKAVQNENPSPEKIAAVKKGIEMTKFIEEMKKIANEE